MSTLKANAINNISASVGGIAIDSSGVVSGSLPSPNRNLLYNGAMQIHQRSASVAGITGSGYNTADRWLTSATSIGTWTQTIENDAPTGSGFRKSLRMLCTTADSAPASTDSLQIIQYLEGQDLQRIAKGTASAKQLTLSFWVKSSTTGTYAAELNDNDNGRFSSFNYTISASATWEKKIITFPADTTGVLDNDNNISLYVRFWLASGSAYTTGTQQASWVTTSSNLTSLAPSQVNLASTTNNYWQITGVQLETGSATDFEFKSYGQELRECQRYFQRSNVTQTWTGNTTSGNTYHAMAFFRTEMRTAPHTTVLTTIASSGFSGNAIQNGVGTDAIDVYASANSTGRSFYQWSYTVSAEL